MDYKYIEQLLERYFACETSLQEEQILHAFFAQDEQELPEPLRKYAPVFCAMKQEDTLGDDFDQRILAMTEGTTAVKARTVKMGERLRPLFKAAAVVAVILSLSNAMNISLKGSGQQNDDINYANYKDTYDDPAMAYDQVEDALQLLSEGFSMAARNDSMRVDSIRSRIE
jgi:hypothetical protein